MLPFFLNKENLHPSRICTDNVFNVCRYGKRTISGILKDGYSSLARYYYNNLHDGKRQVWRHLNHFDTLGVVNFDFKIRSHRNSASTTLTLLVVVYFDFKIGLIALLMNHLYSYSKHRLFFCQKIDR